MNTDTKNMETSNLDVNEVYIVDTVKHLQKKKVYDPIMASQFEYLWIIKGSEWSFRFYTPDVKNEKFSKDLNDKSAIGKTYLFTCKPRGRRIIEVEERK